MEPSLKILVFSWNADGLRLCETDNQAKADKSRKGFFAALVNKNPCLVPDFFDVIEKRVESDHPDIVMFTTENEAEDETYFHAEFLPEHMESLNYTKYYREKLKGVGRKIQNEDPPSTGKVGIPALRCSVYVQGSLAEQFFSQERDLRRLFPHREIIGPHGSGALAVYLKHRDYGKICLVALHRPEPERFVRENQRASYQEKHSAHVRAADTFLQDVVGEFYENRRLSQGDPHFQPDYLIVAGDLGLNLRLPESGTLRGILGNPQRLQSLDELQPKNHALLEGVDGRGPTFAPNWSLRPNRSANCDSANCYQGIVAAWRDRVLYRSQTEAPLVLHCRVYDKVESSTIRRTTHNAVYATFTLEWE